MKDFVRSPPPVLIYPTERIKTNDTNDTNDSLEGNTHKPKQCIHICITESSSHRTHLASWLVDGLVSVVRRLSVVPAESALWLGLPPVWRLLAAEEEEAGGARPWFGMTGVDCPERPEPLVRGRWVSSPKSSSSSSSSSSPSSSSWRWL